MLDQIETVCKDPAVSIFNAFKSSKLRLATITKFLKDICVFLKTHQSDLAAMDYLIKLNFVSTETKTKLDSHQIINALENDSKIIEINQNLSIVSLDKIDSFSNSGISSFCLKNKCVCVFVHNGSDITIYVKGVPAKELNINYPLSLPRVNKRTARQSRDYKLAIMDFYNQRVKHNITEHWANKSKRILRGGKTEDVFQDELANWLDENISDGLVMSKVKKISKDETDIEIIAIGGNSYLIEIKWLGKNESNTSHDQPKIKDSIIQVKNYLKTDLKVLDSALVIYDGRDLEKFKQLKCIDSETNEWKQLKECLKQKVPIRSNCYVFFLISQSASVRKN